MKNKITIPKNPTKKEIEIAARALWNEKSAVSQSLSFDLLGPNEKKVILKRAKAALVAIRRLYS